MWWVPLFSEVGRMKGENPREDYSPGEPINSNFAATWAKVAFRTKILKSFTFDTMVIFSSIVSKAPQQAHFGRPHFTIYIFLHAISNLWYHSLNSYLTATSSHVFWLFLLHFPSHVFFPTQPSSPPHHINLPNRGFCCFFTPALQLLTAVTTGFQCHFAFFTWKGLKRATPTCGDGYLKWKLYILNLIARYKMGIGFPLYISSIHTAYIGEYLYFRHLIFWWAHVLYIG